VKSVSHDSPDIDEKAIRHEDPNEMASRICEAKGAALVGRLRGHRQVDDENVSYVLITADQVTTHSGEVHEKPESKEQARTWLKSYIENVEPILSRSAVAVWDVTDLVKGIVPSSGNKTLTMAKGVDVAEVHYLPFESEKARDEAIERVIAKGNCMVCAGAITIEDDTIPVRIEGERESVFGMPVGMTEKLILSVMGN